MSGATINLAVGGIVPSNTTTLRCTCGDGWFLGQPRPICPAHPPSATCAAPQYVGQTFTATWQPPPPRMSDEDIDRIARRVVEMLKETP